MYLNIIPIKIITHSTNASPNVSVHKKKKNYELWDVVTQDDFFIKQFVQKYWNL